MAAVGNVLPHGLLAARELAGAFGDAFLATAALCHARPVHQQLVGRFADVWRRLAQQSPRASDLGLPRLHLVRDRYQLVRDLDPEKAWAGVGYPAGDIVRRRAGAGGGSQRTADCARVGPVRRLSSREFLQISPGFGWGFFLPEKSFVP